MPTRTGSRATRRWSRAALLAAGVLLAVVELRGHLPSAASTWAAVRRASPVWLAAAAVLQVVSMAAFAEQQRRLLAAFGVHMPAAVSLAVSYARSAMATALPAGSAVSAGYAFRQFRSRGASQPTAAAVMLLSGVASVAGLALLYAGDALAWASGSRWVLGGAGAGAVAVAWWLCRQRPGVAARTAPAISSPVAGASVPSRLRRTLHDTVDLARTVPAHQWLRVVALAMVNWLTDLVCLVTALHAVGLSVPARIVATAYLAAQLVRQIPATPGGIGVVEASLMLTLTAAGAPAAPAAAAVLIYRVLSCWAILPIGLACWVGQRAAEPAAGREPAPAAA